MLINQFLHRDAGRRELDAGLLDTARDRKRAQAFAAVAAMRGKPCPAFFKQFTHPVQGFEIVFQRWPAEQADLRDVRWAQPWQATFAFDRFNHGGFFAAYVRSGTSPQFNLRHARHGRRPAQFVQFGLKHVAAAVVFVAQVNVNFGNADSPSCNQHAF